MLASADRRPAARHVRGSRRAPPDRGGRDRDRRQRAARTSAGPRDRSATTYGYYSLRHDYPVFHAAHLARKTARAVSGHGRRQAAAGRLLHRRPAAGASVAAVSAGHAPRSSRCGRTARPGYHSLAAAVGPAALRTGGDGLGVPDPGRGAALADEVLAGSPDRAVDLRDFPDHSAARAAAHASLETDLLRVREPVDGHARLHRPARQRGVEGSVARARRPRCATCRASSDRGSDVPGDMGQAHVF